MKVRTEEIKRKILHIFSGSLVPGAIFYLTIYGSQITFLPSLGASWAWPLLLTALAALGFFAVEIIRQKVPAVQAIFHKTCGYMLREEEKVEWTGATWIAVSAFICVAAFANKPHITAMVMSTFIWGDAVAALVGQSIGRIKIGKKSLEGSIACFVLCMLMYLVLFPLVPNLLDAWNGKVPLVIAIIASLATTVMELFPFRFGKFVVNDNLTVPVLTGVLVLIVYPIFA